MGFDLGNAIGSVGNWLGGAASGIVGGVGSVFGGGGGGGGGGGQQQPAIDPATYGWDPDAYKRQQAEALARATGRAAGYGATGTTAVDRLTALAGDAMTGGRQQQLDMRTAGSADRAAMLGMGANARNAGIAAQGQFSGYGNAANAAGVQRQGEFDAMGAGFGSTANAVRASGEGAVQRLQGLADTTRAMGAQQSGQFGDMAGRMQAQGQGYGAQAQGYAAGDAQAAAAQQGMANQLGQYAQQGPGPSAAEAQLRQATDTNMGNALAMARSGRGVGGDALAMRQAGFTNAATQQQAGGQLAELRANEAASWRNQQLQAMGLQQQGLGQMRGQGQNMYGTDVQAQGQANALETGARQAGANTALGFTNAAQGYDTGAVNAGLGYENAAQGYGNLALGAGRAGTEAGLGYSNLGAGYLNKGADLGLGYSNLGAGYDTSGINTGLEYNKLGMGAYESGQTTGLGYNAQGVNAGLGYGTLQNNAGMGGDELNYKYGGSTLNAISGRDVAGIQSNTSMNVAGKQQEAQLGGAAIGAAGSLLSAGLMMSDERTKTGIRAGGDDAEDLFRSLRTLAWQYRGDNKRRVGPMAQDLERTPEGASMVHDTPAGKMVDTRALALANAAETAHQRRQIDRLMDLLGGA